MKQAGRPPREAHPKHSFEGDDYMPDFIGIVTTIPGRPRNLPKREFPPGFDLNPDHYKPKRRNKRKVR
jgi:hypothetical protein